MELDDRIVLKVMKRQLARFVTNTFRLLLQLFPNFTQQNSSTLYLGIMESVCGLHDSPNPHLNLSFELSPSWNNIEDTFLAGPQQIQHVLCDVRTQPYVTV